MSSVAIVLLTAAPFNATAWSPNSLQNNAHYTNSRTYRTVEIHVTLEEGLKGFRTVHIIQSIAVKTTSRKLARAVNIRISKFNLDYLLLLWT